MDLASLIAELPVERRLALAYGAGRARRLTLGLFALDQRLAGVVRQAREPMLGQLRLAWWRDQLTAPPRDLPAGEPLLELLEQWGEFRAGLAGLVEGWEGLLGEQPDLAGFAAARGAACATLARCLDHPEAAESAARAGRDWAIAELPLRLSNPHERADAESFATTTGWAKVQLPRVLRPLLVLHGLARRSKGQTELLAGPGSGLVAARVGLLGF